MKELNNEYWLSDTFTNPTFVNHFKNSISSVGYYDVIDDNTKRTICRFYSYKLCAFLNFTEPLILIKTVDGCESQPLIGWEYFDLYQSAYNEGLAYFNKLMNDFDNNRQTAIARMYDHYYLIKHADYGLNEPWQYLIGYEPRFISNDVIKRCGFYSGILSKLQELIQQYRVDFGQFIEKIKPCSTIRQEATLSQPQIALMHYYLYATNSGQAINGNNMKTIAKKYGYMMPNSGIALRNLFNQISDFANRTNSGGNKRTDGQKKLDFEIVIDLLGQNPNYSSALAKAKTEFAILTPKLLCD